MTMRRKIKTIKETTREFKCPACSGRVLLGKVGAGIAALHTVEPCAHFLASDTMETILGPENYAKLGTPLED